MIDRIEAWDNGTPIYTSDIYPYLEFIGYEDRQGNVHLYIG